MRKTNMKKMLKQVQHNIKCLLGFLTQKLNKSFAFTLAEILITLGIIGVVAALTIPSLQANINKRQIETKLVKVYSSVNNAFKLAENDYGDMDGWMYPTWTVGGDETTTKITTEQWLNTYFFPYYNPLTISQKFHLSCVWYKGIGIKFLDGTGLACGTNDGAGSDDFICLYFIKSKNMDNVRDNTKESERLVPGKDYFVFTIKHNENIKGFEPYLSNECFKTTGTQRLPSKGCANVIKQNNWKIPRNYPITL